MIDEALSLFGPARGYKSNFQKFINTFEEPQAVLNQNEI